jgi:hypothetical protein
MVVLWPSAARATSVAVAAPAASESVPSGLVGAVAEIARQVVEDAEGVELVGSADLSITDLQLARGCIGETAECLGPIAEDLSADVLLVPRLDAAAGYVLTLVTFRASHGEVTRVVRRGDEDALVEGLTEQVHEALGLPPPEAIEETPDEADEPDEQSNHLEASTQEEAEGGGPGAGPFVVAGVGLVAIGVGAALGGAALGAQSEYEETTVVSTSDADAARDAYDRASALSLGANILFAAGGALAVGGLVWLLVAILGGDEEEEENAADVAVVPAVTPKSMVLELRGRL